MGGDQACSTHVLRHGEPCPPTLSYCRARAREHLPTLLCAEHTRETAVHTSGIRTVLGRKPILIVSLSYTRITHHGLEARHRSTFNVVGGT